DCSIQRRHQKIVEEAPAPGLDRARREFIGEAAVAAARAALYVGAGTVEFIAETDSDRFYFMEMNTRLQVEHPVTEAVTGLDLVEWQLRVAAGEKLPLRQDDIALAGHAIEVRLYAENPERGFLPATGRLDALHLPMGAGVRVESGVREGDVVTPFYDPMIAKIIASGEDRDAARARLAQALADTAVFGLATNLGFLARVIADPGFAAGAVDTGFVERHRAALVTPPGPPPDIVLTAAALHRLLAQQQAVDAEPAAQDRFTPWARSDGWRLNLAAAPQDFVFRCGGEACGVSAACDGREWHLSVRARVYRASAERLPDRRLAVILDGVRRTVRILEAAGALAVWAGGESWVLRQLDPLMPPAAAEIGAGRLSAPMPGRVVQLLVAVGDVVRQGQPLVVVEAMKMEHTVVAPRDGTVAAVHFAAGEPVEEGVELIALADPDAAPG
ncbi:MAG TPA: biotin/lipoyl-containing protein, partial [Stellaceae bacterium]|nr:biotin/lipoyl-containing protein [Stellaceae bacterium]